MPTAARKPGALLAAWPIVTGAAIASFPRVLRGLSCGHDFDFHLVSWLEVRRSWQQGVLYPPWAQSPNWGAGEPRFVFYPPLSWALGAVLGILSKWEWAPTLFVFLCLVASGLATRALARRFLPAANATLAGALATCLPYPLFTAYERGAFGELAAAVAVPLLLLYALQSRPQPAPGQIRRALDGSAAPLALIVAATWLTNAPAGVMLCYLLAATACLAAFFYRSWWPILRAAISVLIGLGLAAFYLVPAAWEQRWITIAQATDIGMRVQDSWLFARHASPDLEYHDQVLLTASVVFVVTLALAALGLLASRLHRALAPESRIFWLPLALLIPVILLLQFPISTPFWMLPKLSFLQFPWRWLMVLGVPAAIFLAAAVPLSSTRARRISGIAVAIGLLGISCAAALFFFQACDEEDNTLNQVRVFQAETGVEGTDEYAPTGADNAILASGLPWACLVTDPLVPLGQPGPDQVVLWSADQHSCQQTPLPALWETEDKRFSLHTDAPGYLVLRLRRYPAWRITVDNRPVATPLPTRADGLLAIPVPAGNSTLRVRWSVTTDVMWGHGLSALSVLLLMLLWLWERGGTLRLTLRIAPPNSASRLS